uniref:Ubiquitin carboxyl-terminal hydrolase n=1 Tax=Alexandrium monilatum TaxID=311494 RepID=A0A7S4UNP6_9DINO|mmetsp:Transcript_92975/g.277519  ORF Transcript_92975/g.277519 Transcript_92975/m.277519 type:complete len:267 (+) Transcript_92975:67-867(+)
MDPLAEINDRLRKQGLAAAEAQGGSQWLALESNPEVFNEFCTRIGLPSGWGFVDVIGLDQELLDMTPGPVIACVVLFPCTRGIYDARRRQDAALRSGREAAGGASANRENLFFVRQVADFGNACGTIACLHAVSNSRQWLALAEGAALEGFVQAQACASPEERGRALLKEPLLRASSDAAASDPRAQTAVPARSGPALDHHFAAFVRSPGGRLVELDGTKFGPVDHGPTSEASFLSDAAGAIKRQFVASDPDVHGFALMALAKLPE